MKLISALIFLFIISNANGQQFNSDFRKIAVNRKVKDFPDKFDLTSPLNSFVTLKYILMNGKDGLQWKICSAAKKSLLPDSTTPDSKVPENVRLIHLNTILQEIILYKDSVAFIISQLSQDNGESFYSVRNFHPEKGGWVVNGEDLFPDIETANEYIRRRAGYYFKDYQSSRNN